MKIGIDIANAKPISPKLYGIFFEDINFSIDGGINNNQIVNPSFEETYYDYVKNFWYYYCEMFHAKRKKRTLKEGEDFLNHWYEEGFGVIDVRSEKPIAELNPHYAHITAQRGYTLINPGYNGGNGRDGVFSPYRRSHAKEPAVGVKAGHVYEVSCFVRVPKGGYKGHVECFVGDGAENLFTRTAVFESVPEYGEWVKVSAVCEAVKTGIGYFYAVFEGEGELEIDSIYFGDTDYWHAGDPKWSQGRMRKDLAEALRDLHPKFMRFPGGCLVEGLNLRTSYNWKETVGRVEARGHKYNLWGEAQRDHSYMQSNEIGFYEYFLLAEDLGAEPMPILNAGLACQGRSKEYVTVGDNEFDERLKDILDLIEYANGDPEQSEWARLRAESGHPEPFGLKMIGIGNENFGEIYNKNFDVMAAAVKEKYPDIEIIWSAGFNCFGHKQYEQNRAPFDGKHPDVIVDDHFYREPEWLILNADMYDKYPRTRNRIFLGEYAGNGIWSKKARQNSYYSALSEACYLTGLERNADIVVMSSYAPLFSRVGGEQWKHNMINFNSLHTLRTANYMVQREYMNNYGPKYINIANPASDDVYSSVTADDEYIYIKTVNVARVPKKIELTFTGVTPLDAELIRMSCDNDEARNNLPYYGEPEEPLSFTHTPIEIAEELCLPPRSVTIVKTKYAL